MTDGLAHVLGHSRICTIGSGGSLLLEVWLSLANGILRIHGLRLQTLIPTFVGLSDLVLFLILQTLLLLVSQSLSLGSNLYVDGGLL